MSRKNFAAMAAMLLGAVSHAGNLPYEPYMEQPRKANPKFSDKPIKVVDSRQLKEFSIKGHKVMAYSRKDAITRLKHMKKI